MPGPRHELHAQIQIDPTAAKAAILDALRKAKMHKGEAAAALGCSHGTFLRWIAELDMSKAIEALAKKAAKEGWAHKKNRQSPGRPVGAKDKTPRRRRGSVDVNPG